MMQIAIAATPPLFAPSRCHMASCSSHHARLDGLDRVLKPSFLRCPSLSLSLSHPTKPDPLVKLYQPRNVKNHVICTLVKLHQQIRTRIPPSSHHHPLKLLENNRETVSSNFDHQKEQEVTQSSIREDLSSEVLFPAFNEASHSADAPLINALKLSAQKKSAGFHFPGHNRGRAAPPLLSNLIGLHIFAHDLPELPEFDDLFSPKGAILDAQKKAAKPFGASKTWFLVGGSTCGVHASVMATCSPGDVLVLPRNSHISAMSAMVLSGALPKYVIPEYNSDWDISGVITTLQVEKAIKELKTEGRRIGAVLIPSPTYHGICSDLKSIAELCHSYDIPVIVDEAHGAHFKFHPLMPPTALEQGADLAVQSTHKDLSSLTQSSMLHMSGSIVDSERISRCLQTLQSTSPSYLLLASLDAARAQLCQNPDVIFKEAMSLASESKIFIEKINGISIMNEHDFSNSISVGPLRVTIGLWDLGLSGYEADEILCEKHDVIAELAGTRSLTLAISLGTSKEHTRKLIRSLVDLSEKCRRVIRTMKNGVCGPFADICTRLSPRDAAFAVKKRVNIEDSVGQVCGEFISSYPPGIPVFSPGEIITEEALSYLLDVRDKGATINGAADPELASFVVCT